MKKNLPIIVLCCITIIILIESFFIQYILKSTRLYPKTEIVLKIEKDNLDEFDLPLNISEDSIEKLYKTINEASLKENTDSLIDIFDKERNFYINFITIISIVLSILGITPVIYGIFEKNENARLQEELENLKNEYDNQLDEIRIQNFFNLIKDKTEAAKNNINFVFDDTTIVSSIDDFERFIEGVFKRAFSSIKIDLLKERHMQEFAILINNFFICIIHYSNNRFDTNIQEDKNNKYCIIEIPILKGILVQLCTLLSKETYTNLIKTLESFPLNPFDYSNLQGF